MSVGKHDLAAKVAADTGLTKKDAVAVVESVVGNITAALKEGEKVSLQGFATLKVAERAERVGRNPQTGEEILIPARKAPVAKFSDALKAELN